MEDIRNTGIVVGPPLSMVDKGLARIIPFDELPHGEDWESWQREEVATGKRIFTQWLFEVDAPKFELKTGQVAARDQVEIAE